MFYAYFGLLLVTGWLQYLTATGQRSFTRSFSALDRVFVLSLSSFHCFIFHELTLEQLIFRTVAASVNRRLHQLSVPLA